MFICVGHLPFILQDKIFSRPLLRQEKMQLKPKAKLQFAFG